LDNEFKEGKEPHNAFLLLSMIIFTLGTFTLETFISSRSIEMIYIVLTIITLIIAYLISKKKITIYKVEIMWLFFISYFILNMAIHEKLVILNIIDLFSFCFMFIFLLLVKLNKKYFKISIVIILSLSIIYSFSSLFQYLNFDLYSRLILPRFSPDRAEEVWKLFSQGGYTGFTWQTAFISGYIICGLGIIILSLKFIKNKTVRFILLLNVPIMLIALFMSGKRAHLIFMIIALLVTYIYSQGNKRIIVQISKAIFTIIPILILIVVSIMLIGKDEEGPINKIFIKFNDTIGGLLAGEDITSGRIYLYDYALKHFFENPLFGIGWREFKEISVGVINTNSGSHPHNIYIQLLTELGIPGFILFIIPTIYTLILTIKLLLNYNEIFRGCSKWKFYIQFSLYIQVFFLLYGITGNLLTDHLYLYMYVFAVAIILSAIKYSKIKKS